MHLPGGHRKFCMLKPEGLGSNIKIGLFLITRVLTTLAWQEAAGIVPVTSSLNLNLKYLPSVIFLALIHETTTIAKKKKKPGKKNPPKKPHQPKNPAWFSGPMMSKNYNILAAFLSSSSFLPSPVFSQGFHAFPILGVNPMLTLP